MLSGALLVRPDTSEDYGEERWIGIGLIQTWGVERDEPAKGGNESRTTTTNQRLAVLPGHALGDCAEDFVDIRIRQLGVLAGIHA